MDITEATPLDPENAQILALESGSLRGHTLKVLLIENAQGPPVVSERSAAVEAKLAAEPRLRQRLVPAPGTPARLSWQDDPAFKIDHHVRAILASERADEPTLRQD